MYYLHRYWCLCVVERDGGHPPSLAAEVLVLRQRSGVAGGHGGIQERGRVVSPGTERWHRRGQRRPKCHQPPCSGVCRFSSPEDAGLDPQQKQHGEHH